MKLMMMMMITRKSEWIFVLEKKFFKNNLFKYHVLETFSFIVFQGEKIIIPI